MKDPDPVSCHDAQNARYTLNYEEPIKVDRLLENVTKGSSLLVLVHALAQAWGVYSSLGRMVF